MLFADSSRDCTELVSVEMLLIKLFCLVKFQKWLSKLWLYSIHDVISDYSDTQSW